MPDLAWHRCAGNGGLCRALVKRGYCSSCAKAHQAEKDRRRGTFRERGYGTEWDKYSRRWLARFPFCGTRADGLQHAEHSRCTAAGRIVKAQVTDHIRPIRAGGAMFDPANHQSLCRACNSAKDARRT